MSAERLVYADSSSLVKLAVEERESDALRAYLGDAPHLVSSALVRVEVSRAVRRYGQHVVDGAMGVIEDVGLLPLSDAILSAAATLDAVLHSLDAIHVAAALSLGDVLTELITCDRRMIDAAAAHGLTVVSPS